MKRTTIVLLVSMLSLTSCYEDYIKDYETTTAGFAMQSPLRTVISDRDMSIYVGVSLGGKREVDMADWATFVIDPTLLYNTGLELLPEEYYELSDPNTFRVRKSNLPVADVGISFTDAFYADPLSLETHYALPFSVVETSMDQIREGADYSIVAVKYVSSFSGTWYVRGEVAEVDSQGNPVYGTTRVYRSKDLIDDETVYLATISPNTLSRPGIADLSDGGYILTIDNGGESGGDYDVTVSSSEGGITVTGTGRYVYKSDEFTYNGGDEPCPEIDLEYTFETGGKKYRAIETLVLRRDPLNDLRVEEWQ